ncbi:MAG: ThiF family adenylyltransferase, partial [Acidobacteria bacterium]|nr:ThiF family adenylyltransferase [Acidobacteriota bacterium]
MFAARNPRERELLERTRISIIGCGSFGSALADMLVRAGVGRLTLIDPEPLAAENLGRHMLTGKDV